MHYEVILSQLNSIIMQKGRFLPWETTLNTVINKDQIGKPKPVTYLLPVQSHAYGLQPEQDPEGAQQLIYSWAQIQKEEKSVPRPDFKKINRLKIQQRCRPETDVSTIRQSKSAMRGSKRFLITLPQQQFLYGQASLPGQSIKKLIQNNYMNQSEADLKASYCGSLMNKTSSSKGLCFYSTKSHRLLKLSSQFRLQKSSAASSWKLNRFSQVPSRVRAERPFSHTTNKGNG